MWIPLRQYETMHANLERARQQVADLQTTLTELRRDDTMAMWKRYEASAATLIELKARVASLESHLSWMANHVNRLEVERTQLLSRLGVAVPVPSIEFEPSPPAQRPRETPLDPTVERMPDEMESVEQALHQAVTFEDMGHDRAARYGVRHAPDGTVEYLR